MRSLTRAFVTGALAVLILMALWWSRADQYKGQAASAPTRRAVAAAPQPPPPTIAPLAAHQPKPVIAKLDKLDDWLRSTFAKAEPTLLGVDCGAMPCLIAVRFRSQALSGEEQRALLAGVLTEVERRVGFAMAGVHSDRDLDGLDYLWMYGLPSDLAATEVEMLRTSAEARYTTRMDSLRTK
jgi:hypothetical protein